MGSGSGGGSDSVGEWTADPADFTGGATAGASAAKRAAFLDGVFGVLWHICSKQQGMTVWQLAGI